MRFLPLLALLAAVGACTARVEERSLVRPVTGGALTQAAVAQAAPAYTLTEHRIAAPDGARLYAVHLRQPGARATLLYFGGNGYAIGRYGAWTAGLFAPLGVDLFLVDHRGYGLSEGTPTIPAMEADALAVHDHLRARLGAGAKLLVHGHSLGSFMAGHVASNRDTAGAVLESSATTTEEWVKAGTPGAAKPFLKVEIDEALRGRGNLANVARIEEPLLLLVGEKDRTTPPALSRGLLAGSPLTEGRKRLVVVRGANHVNVMEKPEAVAAYRVFLDALR